MLRFNVSVCVTRTNQMRVKKGSSNDAHARFRDYYEMHPQGAPPLMVVDMSKPRPFVLDTSLAELADVIPY